MGKTKKIVVIAIFFVLVVMAAAISLTIGWRPFLGPRTRATTSKKFEVTPQRLDRGKYIFTALGACQVCHSQHDYTKHGNPVIPGTEGAGQVVPFRGLPGRVVAPNLTPDVETGAGGWTDDQLARAIREGIGHDGRALFPLMPYGEYRALSDEDVASLVVYLRTLKPVHNELPKTEIIFPVKYLIRSAPQPITSPVPAPHNPTEYQAYLVKVAGCHFCHTPQVRGKEIAGMDFAGGNVFSEGPKDAAAANITPDASGIGYYDQALFMQAMRTGYVRARELSSIMPFGVYQNLNDDDLKAMFAYLQRVKPVRHRVDNHEPPTYCKLCQQTHGAGSQN